jgi:sporulation related protein
MSYQFEPAEFDRREELLGDRREEHEESPPHRLLTVAAALAVMAAFAAGLWLAYHEGARHAGGGGGGDVPLIRADASPMMVRPAAPGGLRIPDRNMLIYDPDKRMVEHLLPPPEQPMARPTAAAERAAAAPPPASGPPAAAPAGAPNPSVSAALAPAAAPAVRAAEQPIAPPARTAAAKPSGALPATPPAKGGNVRLQLASVRSADAARLEWDRIRQRNPDLLGALSAAPVRADLGDKGIYYRVETGPIGDLAANRICGELKQRKVGCMIVR